VSSLNIDVDRLNKIQSMRDVIPSHGKIIFILFVQSLLLVASIMIGVIYFAVKADIENNIEILFYIAVLIIILIRTFIIIQFKGVTLIFFIFGIRYVDVSFKQYISKEYYKTFWWEQLVHNLKLSGFGRYTDFMESQYTQTRIMKELGIIYVDKKAFDRYLKDQPKETL
jgi:hypothetical protein